MTSDRLVQAIAVIVAIVLATLGGRMLPRIVDSASESVVLVEVTKDVDGTDKVVERIPVSQMRGFKTITPTPQPGAPFEFNFDAGGQSWKGAVGDLVDAGWIEDNTRRNERGLFVGSDGYGLRYTDVAVDGAPPIVALGTAMGAFRGLIVDYLWIKVNMMKEKGLFFETMADADLITKLQPRFGEVWAFHGHNMAYNISVLTNTPEERWEWVQAGINLVRDRGLRYNPNDVVLYKELAFWFSHKIDGVSDDAHLYYKRMLAREWQYLLGLPPPGHQERMAWMEKIARAPETLDELYAKNPATKDFVDAVTQELSSFDARLQFHADLNFLLSYGQWRTVKESNYAKILRLEEQLKRTDGDLGARLQNRLFQAFDKYCADPARAEAVDDFITFLRRKVLRENYNMDARLMWQYTRDTGPLDWRHPAAHALYWARRGGHLASLRYSIEDNISKIVNNDRTEIQAMQALARSGIISYDAISQDNPTRLSDPRWTMVIDNYFAVLHGKFFHVPGGIPDSFTHFHENFMKGALRELFRMGDLQGAEVIRQRLNALYGETGVRPNAEYLGDLEMIVERITQGEYEMQPEAARGDVYAALRRGYREGLLLERPDVLKEAIRFASELTIIFRENRYNDFKDKFGERRMADLIGSLETSRRDVFADVLRDTNSALLDRIIMYRRAPVDDQRMVYDMVKPQLQQEFASSLMANATSFNEAVPEPPGMEAHRAEQAAKASQPKPMDEREKFEKK